MDVADPSLLRGPWKAMLAALLLVIVIGWWHQSIRRGGGQLLLAMYPVFVAGVLLI